MQDVRAAESEVSVEDGFLKEANPERQVGALARQKWMWQLAETVCANAERPDAGWT